jgi:23S rRNA (adenine2503-C2)-methyltransferase
VIDYRSLPRSDLERWAQDQGLPPYRGRQLFRWLWAPGLHDFSQVSDFSKALRERTALAGRLTGLCVISEQHSEDGTIKLGWKLSDGLVVESVFIQERDHATLCISSQVGCAMGCTFCHTARMGFHRQLSPSEIAGQVLAAVEHLKLTERPRNLVFMGMGEPLANYDNVLTSIRILSDDMGLNFSLRRITVSTCGLIPQMLRLGRDTDVGLAISLHATDDETRDTIMPVNRTYSLQSLIAACREYRLSKRRRITFEYLLLSGVNDSLDQAAELASLLQGIPSKINLIPFNESTDLPFMAPADERVSAFQKVLNNAGYPAIVRKSKGGDISAACGQLFAELVSGRK